MNNSTSTIWVKPGNSDTAVAVPPGEPYIGDQDGIAIPEHQPGKVFKTVDNIDATVNPDGSVTTSGGTPIEQAGQFFKGSWKDQSWLEERQSKGDRGWDDLFDQSRRKVRGGC
jgi:hypothetical protein